MVSSEGLQCREGSSCQMRQMPWHACALYMEEVSPDTNLPNAPKEKAIEEWGLEVSSVAKSSSRGPEFNS